MNVYPPQDKNWFQLTVNNVKVRVTMKGFQLTKSQVKRLKVLHKKQRDRRSADKIKVIVLLETGWSLPEVSEALLLDAETFSDFKNACLDFFRRKHKRALDKKLVENFHITDKNSPALICAT